MILKQSNLYSILCSVGNPVFLATGLLDVAGSRTMSVGMRGVTATPLESSPSVGTGTKLYCN